MNVGENIRRLRQKNNMTQEELSQRVGVTISMISQIERGTKAVTLQLGKQISEVLNCRLDELIDESA
jgi:transcriptional regulator with XRE-family HTH domain